MSDVEPEVTAPEPVEQVAPATAPAHPSHGMSEVSEATAPVNDEPAKTEADLLEENDHSYVGISPQLAHKAVSPQRGPIDPTGA